MCRARRLIFLLYAYNYIICTHSQSISRPRGVSLERSYLYKNKNDKFYCHNDSRKIDYSAVNDDYCDCQDASDEPGTSACNNGKFYCENKGFIGRYIYSTRVNDGICDCCDGSDEYVTSVCTDTCKEAGKEYVEKLKHEIQINEAGVKIKEEYIKKAQTLKEQKANQLNEVSKSKETINKEIEKIIYLKNELEAKEKMAKEQYQKQLSEIKHRMQSEERVNKSAQVFEHFDIERRGLLTVQTITNNLASQLYLEHTKMPNNESQEQIDYFMKCDWNNDNLVDDNDIKSIFDNLRQFEYDVQQFYEHIAHPLYQCHPEVFENLHKKIMEPTIAAPTVSYEDVMPTTEQIPAPEAQTPIINDGPVGTIGKEHLYEYENLIKQEQEKAKQKEQQKDHQTDDHNEHENEEEDDINHEDEDISDIDDEDDDDILPRENEESDHKLRRPTKKAQPRDKIDNTFEGEEPDILAYDEATKELIKAKEEITQKYNEIIQKQADLDREVGNTKRFLEADYGPQSEFAVLHGEHFEYTDEKGEYIYKLWLYDRAEQVSTASNSATNMGRWSGFAADESIGDRYAYLKFTDGQQCWNGPKRTTTVKLYCGSENKILAVSEPSRCEYLMTFTTPLKCVPIEQRQDLKPYLQHFKDEL